MRQQLISKFTVLSDTPMFSAHSNMCLVDFKILRSFTRSLMLELILGFKMHGIK